MPSFSLLLATCFPFMTRPALPEDAARGIAPGTTTWSESPSRMTSLATWGRCRAAWRARAHAHVMSALRPLLRHLEGRHLERLQGGGRRGQPLVEGRLRLLEHPLLCSEPPTRREDLRIGTALGGGLCP